MNTQGWIIMILSVSFSTALLGWCLYKIFTEPGKTEHLHSQADIDPKDQG